MHRAPIALLVFCLLSLSWTSSSDAQNSVIPDLVDRVKDGVVSISTVAPKKDDKQKEGEKTEEAGKDSETEPSVGSGFLIDERGTIVTASGVIEGATEITVSLADGTKLPASVVGNDGRTNIALIRIAAAKPLTALKFGDSSKLRVGQTVIAIGNPSGFGGSVSSGIISGLNRVINAGPYDRYIQTDAAINKGNAGGPLLNLDGEVIGINMALLESTNASPGVAFAFPASLATEVVTQLNESGEVRRSWIGVMIQNISEEQAASFGMKEPTGALVVRLPSGSPAAKAGIEPDDVLLSFDGQEIADSRSLAAMVAGTAIGKSVDIKILRKGNERTLKITTAQMPGTSGAKASADTGPAGGADSFDDLKDDLQKLD
ncbi:MAG: trypsin-like peptidase domain-containing protein [Hyphomicrobiales bacterium]